MPAQRGLSIAYTHRSNIAYAIASPEFVAQFHLSDTGARRRWGRRSSGPTDCCRFPPDRWSIATVRSGRWRQDSCCGAWPAQRAASRRGFAALLGFRLLLGLFEAVITPAGLRWIRDHAEERRRGTFTGIYFSGSKYGPAIAAPIAAWLIKYHGWRTMFIYQGLFGLLWVIPWLLFASSGRPETARSSEPEAPEAPFMDVFRSRLMWGTLIGTFSYNYFVFYALTWLPAYFVEQRHLSLTSSGFYSGFSYAGMAAMAVLGGLAADWQIERGVGALAARRGFTIAGLLIASTVVLGVLATTTGQAVFFSVVSMAGLGLATANYWALPQTAMPKEMAGRVGGAQNMALTIAGILAPIATGWLKQSSGGYALPMAATSAILVIGVLAYVVLVRPAPVIAPELSTGTA